LFYTVMTVVSLRMVEISTRLGHKRTLAVGGSIFGFYPLLLGLARGPALFWAASLVGGGAWAITNAGLINRLMERVPDNDRTAGMALHNLVLNLGIMVGSLSGPLLGEWFGLQPAMLVIAGLRFLAGGLFWIWG
jgi:predicted MFS family arabinose efflux permease